MERLEACYISIPSLGNTCSYNVSVHYTCYFVKIGQFLDAKKIDIDFALMIKFNYVFLTIKRLLNISSNFMSLPCYLKDN